jgi:hypothetical protein
MMEFAPMIGLVLGIDGSVAKDVDDPPKVVLVNL